MTSIQSVHLRDTHKVCIQYKLSTSVIIELSERSTAITHTNPSFLMVRFIVNLVKSHNIKEIRAVF
jgi:hypothetical protein